MLYKKYAKDGNVAVVEIDESNGELDNIQLTHNITNSNMGAVDAPNLDSLAYPIIAGERSFAKYQRFHCTDLGGSTRIQNLKIWRTGSFGGANDRLICNLRTSSYVQIAYAQPVRTAIDNVNQDVPTSEPSTANLGIGGALSGFLSAIGFSDFFVQQLYTDSTTVNGSTYTLHYQYDEIA